MAVTRFCGANDGASIVELGAARKTEAPAPIQQIPSDDILQYVREMCATLSCMSIAHRFDRLSGLLAAAAAEAERNMIAAPFTDEPGKPDARSDQS